MAQVVADGAHDGVEVIAVSAFEEVSAQMAIGFAMADDGLDGGAPPQFLLDVACRAEPWLAAEGMQFPWRWDAGTISTNLDGIWGMSVLTLVLIYGLYQEN